LIRRLWDEDNHAVYITNDVQFQPLMSSKEALEHIGFPRTDVFIYDKKLAESIEDLFGQGKWDWDKLTPWKDDLIY
jgi:hypothetical protein